MARKRIKVSPSKSPGPIEIPVIWGSAHDAPTVYANQLLISHAGAEYYLVFGELVPPLVLDNSNLPAKIEIKPLVKIAVTHEMMLRFAEAIQTNIKRRQATFEKGDQEIVN